MKKMIFSSLLLMLTMSCATQKDDFVKGADVGFLTGQEARGQKFYDTAGASSVSSSDILYGVVAYGASGAVTGSMANNGSTSGTIGAVNGTVSIPAGYTSGGTVSLTNVSDCLAANILNGKSILGVSGSLSMVSVSQDSTTKVLSIS